MKILDYGQDALLLAVRLYWGWGFFVVGRSKVLNLEATADAFQKLDIPAPWLNALAAGWVECLGGLLLLIGLGSRLVPIALIVTMIVAYLAAHRVEAQAIFSNPDKFMAAAPFLYMFASLLVLLFGPGRLSLDNLLANYRSARGGDRQNSPTPAKP